MRGKSTCIEGIRAREDYTDRKSTREGKIGAWEEYARGKSTRIRTVSAREKYAHRKSTCEGRLDT